MKKNSPCSGGCGSLIHTGSLMCRPCRRSRRIRVCTVCSATFYPTKQSIETCSVACGIARRRASGWAQRRQRDCQGCGAATTRDKWCPTCFAEQRRAHWRRKNTQRRGARIEGARLSLAQLGDRDGWRCHLCRRRVNRRLVSPHPRSGTFDHLIPVADGGTDSPENLALAHRDCNTRRGCRGVVQLQLVG